MFIFRTPSLNQFKQPAFALLTFALPLFGQTIFELDPYLVTEGPVIERIEVTSSGESITRVGQEQILKLGATDLATALRRVPGISVSRYNVVGAFGGGDGGAIYIRGQGAGRPGAEISTLTDGIARFVGVWTHPLLDTLPTDFASEIEVYKNPQPVRFGNMAFGAVNLISKQATRDGWSGSLRGEYGAYETWSAYGDVGYRDDQFNLFAGYSHRQSDGHRKNSDGKVDAFQGRIGWQPASGWDASFLVQVIDSDASDPEAVGIQLPIVETYSVKNQFYLGQLSRQSGDWHVKLKAYVETGKLDWLQWHAAPPPPFPSQSFTSFTDYGNHGLHSEFGYDNDALALTGGLDWNSFGGKVLEDYNSGPDNTFGEERFGLTTPWADLQWRPMREGDSGQLVVSGGARMLIHGEFADKLAYQGGLRYLLRSSAFYLNYARSYNYPGVFVSVFGRRPPPWTIGSTWQDLDPEEISHWETGLQQQLGEMFILHAAIFHDKVQDALRIVPPPPAGLIYNLGDYTVKGAELTLQGNLREDLSLYTGITFLDADESVPNSPDWTLTAGADWEAVPGWLLSADVQHIGSQNIIDTRFDSYRGEVDEYTLVNLRVSHKIRLNQAEMEIYLRADNIFDKEYEYRPGYPMPGATLTGGVRLAY